MDKKTKENLRGYELRGLDAQPSLGGSPVLLLLLVMLRSVVVVAVAVGVVLLLLLLLEMLLLLLEMLLLLVVVVVLVLAGGPAVVAASGHAITGWNGIKLDMLITGKVLVTCQRTQMWRKAVLPLKCIILLKMIH